MEKLTNLLQRQGITDIAADKDGLADMPGAVSAARLIAANYRAYDAVRPHLARVGMEHEIEVRDDALLIGLLNRLADTGMLEWTGTGWGVPDRARGRFLAGAWLEVLMHAAMLEAGVNAALLSARVWWSIDGFRGDNEIDVIGRVDSRLVFVSCKSIKADLDVTAQDGGSKQRSTLMRSLDETDNWVDLFGSPGDVAVLAFTTDMYDENRNNAPRYSALLGKARRLDVELMPLETLLDWESLVRQLHKILEK